MVLYINTDLLKVKKGTSPNMIQMLYNKIHQNWGDRVLDAQTFGGRILRLLHDILPIKPDLLPCIYLTSPVKVEQNKVN